MNIKGIFPVEIDGVERDTKCTFDVVTTVERKLGKPITQMLDEALNGRIYMSELVEVMHLGLKANGDTRFPYSELGQIVTDKGLAFYNAWYLNFLTYVLVGDSKPDIVEVEDKKK